MQWLSARSSNSHPLPLRRWRRCTIQPLCEAVANSLLTGQLTCQRGRHAPGGQLSDDQGTEKQRQDRAGTPPQVTGDPLANQEAHSSMQRSIRSALFLAIFIMAVGCEQRFLYLESDYSSGHWEDDVLAVELKVQKGLLAVVTITNKGEVPIVVPAPLLINGGSWSSYSLSTREGLEIPTSAAHYDWFCEDRPVITVAPDRPYSAAINLRTAYPAIQPGEYTLLFVIRSDECGPVTWRGEVVIRDVPLTILAS